MSLYLCVFDDETEVAGVDVGAYADFGEFREAILQLEAGRWGTRFPTLMNHPDADGQWDVQDLAALRAELANSRERVSSGSVPRWRRASPRSRVARALQPGIGAPASHPPPITTQRITVDIPVIEEAAGCFSSRGCMWLIGDHWDVVVGGVLGSAGRAEVLDRYVEFVAARCRPNTVMATVSDLRAFFAVIDKEPAAVTPADVFEFISCATSW